MDEHSPGVLAVKINRSGMLDPSSRLPIVTQIIDQQIIGSDFALATSATRSKELKVVFRAVPEIEGVVGAVCANQVFVVDEQDDEDKVKVVLQSLFTQLMTASKEMVSNVLSTPISRLNRESKELKGVIRDIPDIEEVVGAAYANQVLLADEREDEDKVKAVLRSLFTHLMAASKVEPN